MISLPFVQHLVMNQDGSLPDSPDCLYAYIMAGNGVFLHAKRVGLEVLIPVVNSRIASLPLLYPHVNLSQRIPKCLLLHALRLSQQQLPNEMLFWFNSKAYWTMQIPQQVTSPSRVFPLEALDEMGTSSLVDLHSHGFLPPFFSRTDNRDEQGFRIYAVIGEVDNAPSIRVRVGVYSHYFDIPASTIFELPDEIKDIHEQEEIDYEDQ